MSEIDSVISFRDVSYTVGGNRILERLDLDVLQGETLILLGESGCGKTTTLKLINRLIDPTAGSVLVDGKPTTEWDVIKLRRHSGYVLQEAGLFPHFTVAENVALILTLENWDKDKKHARVLEMLDLVGLDAAKFTDRFPHE